MTDEATRQALVDMQRYLADEIAPMMAVDAASTLLGLPPNYGATAVHHWLEAQLSAPDRAVTVSSYLYHAVKKIHLFSELRLVDPSAMQLYVGQLSRLLVKLCPEREQSELRLRLSRIGESETRLAAPVRLLNREAGTEEEEERIQQVLQEQQADDSDPGATGPEVMINPRVAMMMDRLEAVHGSDLQGDGGNVGGGPGNELLASLVGRAAIESTDSREFESSLDRVRRMGIEPELDRVFRQLGNRLPGWDVDLTQMGGPNQQSLGHLLRAMHQIVALAGTPEQGTERFSSMVYAAIEQFNDGHLAQAVAMFDVAQSLIDENKIDGQFANIVRVRAEGSVSTGALRRFASNQAKHGLLRKVLRFFPAFSPGSLLERLDGEPKRELRKLLLSLLEVNGPPCRPQLLDRLAKYLSGELADEQSYYSRNTIFLLRRIPRGSDEHLEYELGLLGQFSRPEQPFMVTKEAVGAVALIALPKAEQTLTDRLGAFEQGAIEGTLAYDPEETLEILDRTCAALARLGTPGALQTVLTHGFRKESELGDTLRRLGHLGSCNLGVLPDHLAHLLETLKKKLPGRLLGVVGGRRVLEITHLIRSLSGTPLPEVQGLFEGIVERYPDREFTEHASAALVKFRGKAAPGSEAPQAMKGDLELFGMPNLLQSMADSEMTGRLVVTDAKGRDRALLQMNKGKIRHCEVGKLRGLDAVCQIFERPQPGSFHFEKSSSDARESLEGEDLDVLSTILEAMRRHDEFQQDRALVPDGSSLMAGDSAPSLPEEEEDKDLAAAVWREAKKGTAPESCEGAIGDAYRIRRLYTHWLENGALAFRPT
jgi:hypothetical protein